MLHHAMRVLARASSTGSCRLWVIAEVLCTRMRDKAYALTEKNDHMHARRKVLPYSLWTVAVQAILLCERVLEVASMFAPIVGLNDWMMLVCSTHHR